MKSVKGEQKLSYCQGKPRVPANAGSFRGHEVVKTVLDVAEESSRSTHFGTVPDSSDTRRFLIYERNETHSLECNFILLHLTLKIGVSSCHSSSKFMLNRSRVSPVIYSTELFLEMARSVLKIRGASGPRVIFIFHHLPFSEKKFRRLRNYKNASLFLLLLCRHLYLERKLWSIHRLDLRYTPSIQIDPPRGISDFSSARLSIQWKTPFHLFINLCSICNKGETLTVCSLPIGPSASSYEELSSQSNRSHPALGASINALGYPYPISRQIEGIPRFWICDREDWVSEARHSILARQPRTVSLYSSRFHFCVVQMQIQISCGETYLR